MDIKAVLVAGVEKLFAPAEVESNGKTVRENNLELKHKIPLGSIVEVIYGGCEEFGLRLFVSKHTRDCDGTPLYNLSFHKKEYFDDLLEIGVKSEILNMLSIKGHSDDSLKVIKEG